MVEPVNPEMDPVQYIVIKICKYCYFLSCILRSALPITLVEPLSHHCCRLACTSHCRNKQNDGSPCRMNYMSSKNYQCYSCEVTQTTFHTSSSSETISPQWFHFTSSSCLAPPLSSDLSSVCSWVGWWAWNSYGLVCELTWAWYLGSNQRLQPLSVPHWCGISEPVHPQQNPGQKVELNTAFQHQLQPYVCALYCCPHTCTWCGMKYQHQKKNDWESDPICFCPTHDQY